MLSGVIVNTGYNKLKCGTPRPRYNFHQRGIHETDYQHSRFCYRSDCRRMTYKMFDKRGRGDSGDMSMALFHGDKTEEFPTGVHFEMGARPRVGVAMRVGSYHARSYQAQDWWQTTLIREIIEDTPNKVVFETQSGSQYTWQII